MGSHTWQTSYIFGQVRVQKKERTFRAENAKSKKKKHCWFYFLPDGKKDKTDCKYFFKLSLDVLDARYSRVWKTKNTTGTKKSYKRGKSTSGNKTSLDKVSDVKSLIKKFQAYESHNFL